MIFCTSIHCMDGRIQESTIKYLKEKYPVDCVDVITDPGPCKILAEQQDKPVMDNILKRIDISVQKHGSKLIFVSGHYDCAGNPVDKKEQVDQVRKSIDFLKSRYPDTEIKGLWIDDYWRVVELKI
jgi:microsomal dipeptidase-like Zn-dependent dipeptidase